MMVVENHATQEDKLPVEELLLEKGGEDSKCEVKNAIGSWGRWQCRIFAILSLTGILNCWHMLVIQFYAPNANHWCRPPKGLFLNISVEEWKNYSIPPNPKVSGTLSRCQMYSRNYSYVPQVLEPAGNISTVDCLYGYDFDTSQFENTIEIEWTLVCDREALAKTAAALYYGGVLVGVLVFGQISDMFGRKKSLMMTVTLSLFAGVITTFMPSLELFFALRFIVAMGAIGAYTTAFVLIMELVDGKWRTIAGVGREYFWCFGYVSLTAIGYLIPGWRNIQLFISVPIVFLLLYWWFVPESPKWLLCHGGHGRREEAYEILKVAAKENGREVPKYTPSEQLPKDQVIDEKATLIDLFRYPVLRCRTLNLYFNWFVVSFVYYGLSLGTNNLGGDIFINFFIAGAIEIPAITLVIWVIIKKGRRIPHCAFMILGGVACLGTAAFEKGVYAYDWPIVTLAMIGKFGISGSFAIVYVYSAELFPTVVRNVGVGSSSLFARIGSMIAPYVDLSRHLHPAIPLVIYGSFSVVSGLLILLLPETNNLPLPQTLEDAENFARKNQK